ncbi:MAG: histidine phosphatase family protein [Lachnospiraceae bacterium]|nr:histidine phosphatase family protein [Lachnospiraceae bacterium]
MELYIVRHGKTEWNKERRLQGSVDIALADEGRALAEVSSENMKGITFDRIYSSPLSRAYETARILRRDRDIPIITDDRLKELCFGDAEGRPFPELYADESCYFRYFFDQPELYRPIGHGESLEELCDRAAAFMKEIILPLEDSCTRVMIVAHGAINKGLMMYVKNQNGRQQAMKDFWSGGLQRNLGVIQLELQSQQFHIIDENRVFYPTNNQETVNPYTNK